MPNINLDHGVDSLEELVEELTRPAPKESKVKRLMDQHGIPYSIDPFERLNSVLMALQYDLPEIDEQEDKK